VGHTVGLYTVRKIKIFHSCWESNPDFLAAQPAANEIHKINDTTHTDYTKTPSTTTDDTAEELTAKWVSRLLDSLMMIKMTTMTM
jgi:hypothetical protein